MNEEYIFYSNLKTTSQELGYSSKYLNYLLDINRITFKLFDNYYCYVHKDFANFTFDLKCILLDYLDIEDEDDLYRHYDLFIINKK